MLVHGHSKSACNCLVKLNQICMQNKVTLCCISVYLRILSRRGPLMLLMGPEPFCGEGRIFGKVCSTKGIIKRVIRPFRNYPFTDLLTRHSGYSSTLCGLFRVQRIDSVTMSMNYQIIKINASKNKTAECFSGARQVLVIIETDQHSEVCQENRMEDIF